MDKGFGIAVPIAIYLFDMNSVTQILSRLEGGDPHAAAELLPLVYAELRTLAAQKLALEPGGQTLQGTALVHEAYLRLLGPDGADQQWDNRGHFFAAAAESMRRILVENARRKQRLKHGGQFERQELDEISIDLPDVREDLLALDEALNKLATLDQAAVELIKLRYFAGLTIPEAAAAMQLAPRSAERLWAFARAWLQRELCGSEETS